MSDELKPCPFCGGKATVSSFPGAHNVWCSNQPIRCGNRSMYTAEQWNTRAQPSDGALTKEEALRDAARTLERIEKSRVERADRLALTNEAAAQASVVLPERRRDSCEDSDVFDDAYAEGWNACLDRVKELNS